MVMRARRGRGVVVKRRVVAGRRGMVGRGRREVRKDISFWMAVEGGMVWRGFCRGERPMRWVRVGVVR